MIRKTAQQRTEEFTSKTSVKKILREEYQLSNEIRSELLDFWTKWLIENPKKEPYDSLYTQLCNFIKSKELNFYERHIKLKNISLHTLEQYQILFGKQQGELKYKSRCSRLSETVGLKTPNDKINAFFSLKVISKIITQIDISPEQMKELSLLLDAYKWQNFKYHWELIADLIKFHHPNYIERYNTCITNNYSSDEYMNARYGNNSEYINYLKRTKSDQGRKNFANCTDYWLSKGFDYDTALEKVYSIQRDRNKRAIESVKSDPDVSPRRLGFWIRRGYSELDAKNILSELQCRDLQFFINKYGSDEGCEKYYAMLKKRQATWFARTDEERAVINASKGKTFEELVSTWGHERAVSIIKSRTSENTKISKESIKFFMNLDCLLGDYSKFSITGYKGPERFVITPNGLIFVDYFLNGKVIEYYGSFWHADPRIFQEDEIHPVINTACKDIWKTDADRIDLLNKLGHNVLIVWSSDVADAQNDMLHRARDFLLG